MEAILLNSSGGCGVAKETGMENISATVKKYSVYWKTVRELDDKYDQLLDCNIGKGKKKRKLHTGGKLCSQQLDNDSIFSWRRMI